MGYRYIYGPVPSRRLGRSLGVDLVSRKTCSLSCVFCQIGRTPDITLERKEYVSVKEVVNELESWLKSGNTADSITLSGMGEPTLHSRFGDILDAVHSMCSIKTALLSNGSIFYLPEVRSAARKADLVKLSLSAWDQESFEKINRPHIQLKFEKVLEGMRTFRSEYEGQLWLEVFVVLNLNSTKYAMRKIANLAESISADRIHLNTVVRPPAERFIKPVSRQVLEDFTGLFHPKAEIIAEFKPGVSCEASLSTGDQCFSAKAIKLDADEERILKMIKRRPCTSDDIENAFGLNPVEAGNHLVRLQEADIIVKRAHGGECYYHVKDL